MNTCFVWTAVPPAVVVTTALSTAWRQIVMDRRKRYTGVTVAHVCKRTQLLVFIDHLLLQV